MKSKYYIWVVVCQRSKELESPHDTYGTIINSKTTLFYVVSHSTLYGHYAVTSQ